MVILFVYRKLEPSEYKENDDPLFYRDIDNHVFIGKMITFLF